jgi:hypothetical protein
MSASGHLRRFDGVLITSGLPRLTDISEPVGMSQTCPNSSHGAHPESEATVAEESATDVA